MELTKEILNILKASNTVQVVAGAEGSQPYLYCIQNGDDKWSERTASIDTDIVVRVCQMDRESRCIHKSVSATIWGSDPSWKTFLELARPGDRVTFTFRQNYITLRPIYDKGIDIDSLEVNVDRYSKNMRSRKQYRFLILVSAYNSDTIRERLITTETLARIEV